MLKREKTNGKVLPPQRCPHRPAAPPAGAALPFISEPHRVARGRGAPGEGTAERSGRGAVRCGVRCGAGGGGCGAHCGPAAPSPAAGAAGGRGEGVRTCSLPGGVGGGGENGEGEVGHCTVDGCFLAGPTLLFSPWGLCC